MTALAVLVTVACATQCAVAGYAGYYPGAYAQGGYAHGGAYHGPLSTPVVSPSGFLADTPEVAAAKAAHLIEVAKASSHAATAPAHVYAGAGYAGYAGAYHGGYHGPLAAPVVTPSGFLADTPEVAAAKAAHLSLVAGASHRAYATPAHSGAYAHGAYADGAYAGAYDDGSYKGEGAYSSHYDDASHFDDGSYKPSVYEHGHY